MNWKIYFSRFFAIGILAMLVITSTGCNLFLSDEEVISKMMTSMNGLNSYSTELNLSAEMVGDPTIEGSLSLFAKSEAMTPKEIDGLYEMPSSNSNVELSVVSQGTTLTANVDLKIVDGIFYLRANTLPTMLMMDFSEYTNQWFKIDYLKQIETFDLVKTDESEEMEVKTKEFYAYLYEIGQSKEANVFIIKENLGKTKVDGEKVYHFKVDLDKEKVIALLEKVIFKAGEIYGQEISNDEIIDFKETFSNALKNLKLTDIELFIDSSDFYPRQIIMPLEIKPELAGAGDVQINLNVDLKYNKFNEIEEGDFVAPEDAIDLMERYKKETSGVIDSRRMSDMAATQTAMALSCSDGKTFILPEKEYLFLNEIGFADYIDFTIVNDPGESEEFCLNNGHKSCNYTIVNKEKKSEFDPCHYRINFYLENGGASYLTEDGIVTNDNSTDELESVFNEDFTSEFSDEELELMLQGLE